MKQILHVLSLFLLSFILAACFHNEDDGGDVTATYTIGGVVTDLEGAGLVLQNNDNDDIAINTDGSFTFSTALADASTYSVTILTQPTSPSQTCTVTNGSGTVSSGNITNVSVTCIINTYTIGGSTAGLGGSGLVLQNNAGDNLSITGNGGFIFANAIADGSGYSVTVLTQPVNPSQTCTVTNGSGTLSGVNITNVSVICVTNIYSIGGTVAGLSGSGLVLQNNASDNLSVTGNGGFTFATPITDDLGYSVTVLTQPTSPSQTCVVGDGSGTVNGADVVDVTVTCTTNVYNIGGSVSGLTGTGFVLQNNNSDDLGITADGVFIFSASIADGNDYNASVLTQPVGQHCTIFNGSGTVAGANVTNISVTCATAYTNADLNSDYLFIVTEIHDPVTGILYCDLAGTLSFDGDGTVLVDGTRRCSGETGVTTTALDDAMDYEVLADGSFTTGSPPLHGQIVLSGNSLLFDGTLEGTDAGDYLEQGVAMKRVTSGSPPTYNNASLNGDYLFTHTEVYSNTIYCDEAGTLSFNGDGTASVNSISRCSNGISVTTSSSSGSIYYSVSSDGVFTLSDRVTDPDPARGQIALDGKAILVNSALSAGSAHLWDIVAMKRVAAGEPPTYSNANLHGDYLFIFNEVYDPGTTTYCDQTGTLSFNGDGTASSDGTSRCSNGTSVTKTDFADTLYYDVAANGSFTLSDQFADPLPLHGQITLDGNSLLLDGTLTGTSASKLLNRGVAMKRVAANLAQTWVLCRNEGAFDEKEILSFDGTAGTLAGYSYTTTNTSCSAGESLSFSDTFTYTVGGMVSTTLSGTDIFATTVDGAFSTGEHFFQIYYIDTSVTPINLYMGDETADPELDGTTAEKRPAALQETWPRLLQ